MNQRSRRTRLVASFKLALMAAGVSLERMKGIHTAEDMLRFIENQRFSPLQRDILGQTVENDLETIPV